MMPLKSSLVYSLFGETLSELAKTLGLGLFHPSAGVVASSLSSDGGTVMYRTPASRITSSMDVSEAANTSVLRLALRQ